MNSYGFIKSFCYIRSPKGLSDSVVGSSFVMLPPDVQLPPPVVVLPVVPLAVPVMFSPLIPAPPGNAFRARSKCIRAPCVSPVPDPWILSVNMIVTIWRNRIELN